MANNTGKKFGGREKGTLNKVTSEIKEKYSILVDNNIDRLQEDIDSLDPKDRIKIIIELSKFFIPNLKAREIIDNNDGLQKVTINFKED